MYKAENMNGRRNIFTGATFKGRGGKRRGGRGEGGERRRGEWREFVLCPKKKKEKSATMLSVNLSHNKSAT